MDIGRDDMPPRPSGPALFRDKFVPLAVNVAGGLEVVLQRASYRTGIRPSLILAGITGVVTIAAFRVWGSRPRRSRRTLPNR